LLVPATVASCDVAAADDLASVDGPAAFEPDTASTEETREAFIPRAMVRNSFRILAHNRLSNNPTRRPSKDHTNSFPANRAAAAHTVPSFTFPRTGLQRTGREPRRRQAVPRARRGSPCFSEPEAVPCDFGSSCDRSPNRSVGGWSTARRALCRQSFPGRVRLPPLGVKRSSEALTRRGQPSEPIAGLELPISRAPPPREKFGQQGGMQPAFV